MKIVDALSLKYKLYILLSLVIFGLILSAAIGYVNISKMKKNLDSLYFGSLIPVTELSEIRNEYNKELISNFYKLKNEDIDVSEVVTNIQRSQKKIINLWDSYKKHFKRDYEVAYIEYTDVEIKKSSIYLDRLNYTILSLDASQIQELSTKIFLENISFVDKIIKNVINYESSMARYDRKKLLITYDETIFKLAAIFAFLLLMAILIVSLVFVSIQNNQAYLVNASKKLQVANKKLEKASITDALTQLYNRRYFNLIYNRELTRAIREHKRLAFMMLDIDYFKGFNDSYGHLQGDVALKSVAEVMQNTLQRPSDYIFRLGGEEFGVLISDVDYENAYKLADKLRLNVSDLRIEHKASEISEFLSISIGVVILSPDHNINAELIIQTADENLYMAKEDGRNKVMMTELSEEVQPQSA